MFIIATFVYFITTFEVIQHRFYCGKPGLAANPSLKQSPKPGRGPAALFFRVPVLLVLVAKASKLRAEEWTTVNKTSRR